MAIAAGVAAGSIALVGFGFDSVIEAAASVVVWQLRGKAPRERELRALRFIAITFFVLAAYVTFESIRDLVTRDEPASSPVGIALAIVSLLVMPTLAWFKRKTGREMGSAVVVADSAETFLCGWLSAILLVGLVLNATVGWWWADPVAALGIALLAVKEGREAWSGEEGEITPEATRRVNPFISGLAATPATALLPPKSESLPPPCSGNDPGRADVRIE